MKLFIKTSKKTQIKAHALSAVDVNRVSGGDCTITGGTCHETSPGHVVCEPIKAVCK